MHKTKSNKVCNVKFNTFQNIFFRVLIQGGCSPVGCVLTQLLRNWNASVTATCYKRAVPVLKALGASDIIVLTESSVTNDSFHMAHGNNSVKSDLQNQLGLKNKKFDVILVTNTDCVQREDLNQFISPDGLMFSTLPPVLVSDSCGVISTFLLKWYISARCTFKVSDSFFV